MTANISLLVDLISEKQSDNRCIEWSAGRSGEGYGSLRWKGRQVRAHRLSYLLANGVDPGEFVVRHKCDNPPCVRPSHLELGTYADNVRDCIERGRHHNQYRDVTRCKRDHEFTPENTYIIPKSWVASLSNVRPSPLPRAKEGASVTSRHLPPVLTAALNQQSNDRKDAFMSHLNGGTSAEYLSEWLRRAGTPVGATTIKRYRRSIA